jgi:hypothetical protein
VNGKLNRSLIIGLLLILIFSSISNSLVVLSTNSSELGQSSSRGSRPGPKQLLQNTGFGQVSAWDFENGTYQGTEYLVADYDTYPTPTKGIYFHLNPIDNFQLTFSSYINQTFTKNVETPNYPTAVMAEVDYNMAAYDSQVDAGLSVITTEIFLAAKNHTSGEIAQWSIETGPKGFTVAADPRIGNTWYNTEIPVGQNMGSFSFTGAGTYTIGIELKVSVPSGSVVDVYICDFNIDNLTLTITDDVKPVVIANQLTFGPYNSDPGDVIDVNFFSGGFENTSLALGRYRLNNTTPGTWQTIFTDKDEHTDDWDLSSIWNSMVQGENTIDVYSSDAIGNFNDSVQIKVLKDTVAPTSNATELADFFKTTGFDINYTASDASPGGGFNNTVELWFDYNDQNSYTKYAPSSHPEGYFNSSPIDFNITYLDSSYGEGKYEFYTIGIDNASNHETAPLLTAPDATTIIDYSLPVSEANELDSIIENKTFDVEYTASDTGSGIDYVELWYLVNNEWKKFNDSTMDKFTESPIEFTASSDGEFGFKTIGYDKSGNIEKFGIPKIKPMTKPDTTTTVDTQPPSPLFIWPDNVLPNMTYINGETTIKVSSDFDTNATDFYFFLDIDGDGDAEPGFDDKNSTWIFIGDGENTEGNNWSVSWNTADYLKYPYFKSEEYDVLLRCTGIDRTDKEGFTIKSGIEVDNVPPEVDIITPKQFSAENGDYLKIKYQIDHNDGNNSNFYYREVGNDAWIKMNAEDITHPAGQNEAEYQWLIDSNMKSKKATIEIRVEVIDDTGNAGTKEVTPVFINRQGPEIKDNFPMTLYLDEDFGTYKLKLTTWESHTNIDYSGDKLKWYVTGNSKDVFHITGDDSTGEVADTFTYRSILNKYGSDTITFHLYDPLGLEATVDQVVVVNSTNDAPLLNFPSDTIQVTYGESDTFDTSPYISDVDNELSDLTLSHDDSDDSEYFSLSGLKITFNYPESLKDTDRFISLVVSDGKDSTLGNLFITITGNHRPKLVKPFPIGLELKENEPKENYLDLDDYFSDADGDALTYTYQSDDVIISINEKNEVTFNAKRNVGGTVEVVFRARDPHKAWAEGIMVINLLDIPDPPQILPIPDLNIHWHNPASDDGYRFDFSYFVFDPDNDRSELSLWVTSMGGAQEAWWEYDQYNNMVVIFKFPFSAAGDTPYVLALNVADPNLKSAYRIFNVTVIFDEWPIEQLKPFNEVSFPEDDEKENVFDLWEYFEDIDGGSNFEIMDDTSHHIIAEIDENNYLDLSSGKKDWNTGTGHVEVVIIARDTNPIQTIYAVLKVSVLPVNDNPTFSAIPQKNVTINVPDPMDLSAFMNDIDSEDSTLKLVTGIADHLDIEVSGSLLIITGDKTGEFQVEVWVVDDYDAASQKQTLTVKVLKKDKAESQDNTVLIVSVIALVIVIVLILLVLLIVFSSYKVKEVFLIHKSGILLSHLSREHKPGRDEEILSGMFTAVQEFIKDSFSTPGTASGGDDHILKEMKIGENNNILIERGKYVYLAVIFSGRGAGKLRNKGNGILNAVEKKYQSAFSPWVGDMDKISGVENQLQPLIPAGATQVISSDKQLGRVSPPPSTPMAPAHSIPVGGPAAAAAPARTVTPAKPVAAVPAAAKPATAVPAVKPAATPAPTAAAPMPAAPAQTPTAAKPAMQASPAGAAGAGNCPKCGAVPNKFPDGSMLCPKCGYTGK